MAQKIKVQDGNIIYSAPPDDAGNPQFINFDINGQLIVSSNVVVGDDTPGAGTITTSPSQNLTITTGLNADILLVPTRNLILNPTGALSLNTAIWPTALELTTPGTQATPGTFLGASATNTLRFYSFIFAFTGSDTLTVSQLNILYPTIQPGQSVVGPTVIYQCVGLGQWRISQPNLGFTPVNKAGDTMLGYLLLNADPINDSGAATKRYVDQLASGIYLRGAVETSTTPASNLPLNTYTNGASGGGYDPGGQGVGATLIAQNNGNLNTLGVGGYNVLAYGARILVKDQVDPTQNGIYEITELGAEDLPGPGVKWILTRSSDYNNSQPNQVHAGALAYVQEGTLNGTQWVQISQGTGPLDGTIIGTNLIVFSQFSGAGTFTGGPGINIVGNVISNTGVLSNTAGSGISVSSSTGNITLTNTGVHSIIAGSNILVSGSVGNVTVSLGTLPHDALANLTDVTITAPIDYNLLSYDSSISKWINRSIGQMPVQNI